MSLQATSRRLSLEKEDFESLASTVQRLQLRQGQGRPAGAFSSAQEWAPVNPSKTL